MLDNPGLAEDDRFGDNSRRVANRAALGEEIDKTFSTLTGEEAIERLESAGIANAHLNTVEGLVEHPQLEARDRWREVGTPTGPVRALVPPVTFEGLEYKMRSIPAAGEHTGDILGELGYESGEIESLRARGVV